MVTGVSVGSDAYVHGVDPQVPTCHVTVPVDTFQQTNPTQLCASGPVNRTNEAVPDQNIFIPPATSAVPLNVPE
jgi:hypothetical protein